MLALALPAIQADPPVLVADINATGSSISTFLVRLGDRVVFQARNPDLGRELWATDGTSAGTLLVSDIVPGPGSSFPRPLLALGGKVLMTAETAAEGREPWVTDGTAAGTQLLRDIRSGPDDSMARDFIPLGSFALFTAFVPGLGYAIFRTDGTPAGTVQITTTPLDFPGDVLTDSAVLDGRLIFSAETAAHGFEVWITDGTAAGTAMLADVEAGPDDSLPSSFETFGDHVYFRAAQTGVGSELFRTDGTTAGTQLFADLVPGALGGKPFGMTAVEGRFVFSAGQNFLDIELWSSDGTVAGTGFVLDLSTFPSTNSSSPRGFKRVGDRAVFIANSGVDGSLEGFWITDGTAAGTEQVLLGAPEGFVGNGVGQYQFLGGSEQLLFTATSPSTGWELWTWSGTGSAPQLLPEVSPGAANSTPTGVIELGGQVIFSAFDPVLGSELFRLDLLQFGTFGVEAFGNGCSNGTSPVIGFSGSAQLGQTLTVELEGAAPGALALAFYDADFGLTDFGAGCTVYLAAPRLLDTATADATRAAAVSAGIPAVPALVGMDFGIQWVTAESNGPLLGAFGLTDALEIVPAL